MIEIDKKSNGLYGFQLKSESGQILLSSPFFKNKVDIKNTVQLLRTEKEPINKIERKTNHEGKFLFQVKNTTGSIIGESNLYDSEAGMENGIKNLRKRLSHLTNS